MVNKGKVSIIGSGYVGSTTAYTLMIDGVVHLKLLWLI